MLENNNMSVLNMSNAEKSIAKNHYSRFQLYVIYFILITSAQSSFTFQGYFFLFFSAVILGFYTHIHKKIGLSLYLPIVLLLLTYYLGQYLLYGSSVYITNIVRQTSIVFIGVYSAIILNKSFVYLFEKALYVLTIISLILFSIQLIQFNLLFNVLSIIGNILPLEIGFWFENTNFAYVLVYTINQFSTNITSFRNCGFVFEPGYFSIFLNLAIYFNLLLNNFILNKRIVIFLIGVLTTFSTTGLLGLTIIVIFYLLNAKVKAKFIYYVIGIIVIFFIITSSLVLDKTMKLLNTNQTEKSYSQYAKNVSEQEVVSMGRFIGNSYLIKRSFEKPILGHLVDEDNLKNLSVPSSIGPFIFQYGFIIFGLLILEIAKMSRQIVIKQYKRKFYISFALIIFVGLFSFPFIGTPIFWMFFTYAFGTNKISNRFKKNYV